jgi:pimeloyl-ACP methyl ester carboxylesterase
MTDGYVLRSFHAQDGLRLSYRDYDIASTGRTPLLCLSGLTRNSKDFHDLALRHASTRRVLCLDYRGRGRSAYDPDPKHYQAPVYLNDIQNLLAAAHVQKVVVLGTSLGGILTMALSVAAPTMLTGAILNDIGPEVSEDGRQRIADYVGRGIAVPTYDDAVAILRQTYAPAYPNLGPAGWMRIARTTFTEDEQNGGLRLDYDLGIATALREQAKSPLPDLWPLFRAMRPLPLLAFRGELSDVLTTDTFIAMKREHAGMIAVTVPGVGHIPMLDEPEVETAIDGFLAGL